MNILSTNVCTSLVGGISFHVARNTLRSERERERERVLLLCVYLDHDHGLLNDVGDLGLNEEEQMRKIAMLALQNERTIADMAQKQTVSVCVCVCVCVCNYYVHIPNTYFLHKQIQVFRKAIMYPTYIK